MSDDLSPDRNGEMDARDTGITQQLGLLLGNLQGEFRGLSSRLDSLLDQHSKKSEQDAEFRHYVYTEMAAARASREHTERLAHRLDEVVTQLDSNVKEDCRDEEAHRRIGDLEARMRPLEEGSKIRRILRSGTFQIASLLAAWAAVIVSALQFKGSNHP